jgi:hypothetical protein
MDSWYINRLMTMSLGEIYYRALQKIRGYFEERFVLKVNFKSEKIDSERNILGIVLKKYESIPNAISVFGTEFKFDRPDEINWHKDINSGDTFKPIFYRKINIRDNPELSAKNVWEINRLQFLTGICINYKTDKNEIDLDLFIRIIRTWIAQNPFLIGVNWYSNIEVNLRLITWFLCWEILEAEDLMSHNSEFDEFVRNEWLPVIKKHCIYSYQNPSKFSSANNHLISEYAGLFIASSKWNFKESKKWLRYSMNGLESEIIKQHSKEGVNKEEAAEYIQFITDFFLLTFIVGARTGNDFSDRFKERLFKILCYIYNFLDCEGNFPKYGDEDDGRCFLLDSGDKVNNFQSLLTSGAILFNNSSFKSKSRGFDMKNQFLFGEEGKVIYESIPEINIEEGSKFYAEEGHFIFRKSESFREIYMHFDAAPLGFLSIAAHGHADALSFILNVDGQPVFIDPGTYTYHTEPQWRNYFIGTLAHNTVRVNRRNQAVNGGPTLWIKKYKPSILNLDLGKTIDHVSATHDGYAKEGVQHTRDIVFDRLKNEFQILDTLTVTNNTKVQIEIPFHIHPEMNIISVSDNGFLFTKEHKRKTEFYVDEKLQFEVINGQLNPQILGWYSGSFLKKEPTSVIYCRTQIDCSTAFKFLIKIV